MKKSNRELALKYLEKAQKDDAEKIKSFDEACFTDAVLFDLASYTKTDFRKVGAALGSHLSKYFLQVKKINTTVKKLATESGLESENDRTGVKNTN